MWKIASLFLIAAGVGACASGSTVLEGPSPQGFATSFDGTEAGLSRASEAARIECNRTGRRASLTSVTPTGGGPGSHTAYYKCDPSS
jgi:hypothetical protein